MNTNKNVMDTNTYMTETNQGTITQFLWWCAGADEYFLKKSPRQDRVKYAGIGAIVLFTGVLAAISGGVAFNTMFGPKLLAGEDTQQLSWLENNFWIPTLIFGLLWGTLIFNLDRFIVSSTGKGDGTDTITPKEIGQAIPRILIALVLGFSISKPLEILMLKSEIDVQLNFEQQKKREELDKISYAKFDKQILDLNKRLNKIEEEKNGLIQDQKLAEAKYTDQMEGKSGGKVGDGPIAKKLKIIADEKKKVIEVFDIKNKNEITSLKLQLEKKHEDLEKELNVINIDNVKKLDGLLARLDISHKIGFWLGVFITAILLCIEMGPIFFKMMMTKGPYDYMVENFNHKIQTENGVFKEDKLYEGRNGLIHMETYRYADAEIAKQEVEDKVKSQIEINSVAVAAAKDKLMKELKENPDKFIS
ncbi:DUF4407 domain-containing protein [Flavobacterium sp.]|uniref:DUF4407 domain-containing protein n=1 Tax=Flavobacterium sp. TaxID=239 RepID=UPI00333E7012